MALAFNFTKKGKALKQQSFGKLFFGIDQMNMIEVKLFTRSLSRNLGLANRELSCYTNKHLTTSASTVNVNYFIWAEYYWWILDSPWEDIRSQIFVHHKHKETSLPVWPAIYLRLSTWRAKGAYSDTCRILQTRTLPPPGGGGGVIEYWIF